MRDGQAATLLPHCGASFLFGPSLHTHTLTLSYYFFSTSFVKTATNIFTSSSSPSSHWLFALAHILYPLLTCAFSNVAKDSILLPCIPVVCNSTCSIIISPSSNVPIDLLPSNAPDLHHIQRFPLSLSGRSPEKPTHLQRLFLPTQLCSIKACCFPTLCQPRRSNPTTYLLQHSLQ